MARVFVRALLFGAACLQIGCVDDPGQEIDQAALAKYVLNAPPKQLEHKLDLNFDDKVELLGYALDPKQGHLPGKDVKLTMYWKLKQDLEPGWFLFTHVLDGAGERLLNIDNVGPLRQWRGAAQTLPPGAWEPGKIYVDEQTFTIPPNVKSDQIQVVTGVWKGEQRLKVVKGPHDSVNRGRVVTLSLKTKPQRPEPSKQRPSPVPRLRVDKLAQDASIEIDGVLDEPAWRGAISSRRFVEVKTGKRSAKLSLDARVKVLWDDKAMYLGFSVRDEDVKGGFDPKRPDQRLWTSDSVQIMIDPDGDGDNEDYYEILINPQNLVFDSRFDSYNRPKGKDKDGPFGHEDWSSGLTSAVTIQGTLDKDKDKDEGYVVEASIPWRAFDKAKQVPPKPGDTWRMNFYTNEGGDGVAWSPILGKGNFHKAARFGRVTWTERGTARPPNPLAGGLRERRLPTLGGAPHLPGRGQGGPPPEAPRRHKVVSPPRPEPAPGEGQEP